MSTPPEPRKRRLRISALAASLALHAALVLVAISMAHEPRVAVQRETIEIEFRESQANAPVVAEIGPAQPQPSPPALRSESQSRKRRPGAPVVAEQPAAAQPEQAAAPVEPEPPPLVAPKADPPARLRPAMPGAPLAFSMPELSPGAGELVLSPSARVGEQHGVGTLEGSNAGVTRRYGDPGPDAGYADAEERLAVERHVAEISREVLAKDRVEKGLVDGYFTELRSTLDKALEDPPLIEAARNKTSAFLRTFSGAMERFGKTGNPYREGEADGPELRAPEIQGPTAGSPEVAAQRAMARHLHDMRMGKYTSELVAVISIRQGRDGKSAEVKLLESSGEADFDALALGAATGVVDGLELPSVGAGLHEWGAHSVWAIIGRIIQPNALNVIPGTERLGIGGGGTFDFALDHFQADAPGEVRFECRAKLLKVY